MWEIHCFSDVGNRGDGQYLLRLCMDLVLISGTCDTVRMSTWYVMFMYPRSTVPMTRETSVQTQALHFPTLPTLSLCVQWSWKAAWAGTGAASPSPTQLSSKTWSSVGAPWASRPLQPPRPVRSSGMIEEWFRITTNFVQSRHMAFSWKSKVE